MELPNCLCGAHSYKLFRYAADGSAFAVAECRACHLARTWPSPLAGSALVGYYAERDDYELRLREIDIWRPFSESFLAIVRRFVPAGRLLDVGCNLGILVSVARQAGYAAQGLDLSEKAVRRGESALGLGGALSVGTLSAMRYPSGSWDVISYMHCLEHLEDPVGELAEVKRALRPGGVLAIEVPNFFSLWRRLQGAGWYGFVPTQHIWQGGRRGLTALLRRSGFEIAFVSCRLSLYREAAGGMKGLAKRMLSWLAYLTDTGDRLIIMARKPR